MANVVFAMIVFNGDDVLEPCLRTITKFGPVYVTEGPVEYWCSKGYTTSTDTTNDILHSILPEKNIVHGQWREKDEMQRAMEHLYPEDTTHVWLVDSDEIYREEDIKQIFLQLDEVDSVSFSTVSFFGGFERYMTGFEENFPVQRIQRWYPGASWYTHRPPTVLSREGVPWSKYRHLSNIQTKAMGLRLYHYSYTFPRPTKMKSNYYEMTTPHFVIPDWFNKVWIPWATAKSDAERAVLEKTWRGVHNWRPEQRGDCYTVPFSGTHPASILAKLENLKKRWKDELDSLMVTE